MPILEPPGENTLDRATAMMPKCCMTGSTRSASISRSSIHRRLRLPRIKDDETRRAVIRGYNIVSAEYFSGLEDRLTRPRSSRCTIPRRRSPSSNLSPGSSAPRSACSAAACRAGAGGGRERSGITAVRGLLYVLAIDSQYDYDPVWQKCVELGIAPTFHSSASGQGLRNSPSNFVYNHIGHFAAAGHAVSKAIFSRRHPALPEAALRVSRRRRRLGLPAVRRSDRTLGAARRGGARTHEAGKARPQIADEQWSRNTGTTISPRRSRRATAGEPRHAGFDRQPHELDDFAACKITRKQTGSISTRTRSIRLRGG